MNINQVYTTRGFIQTNKVNLLFDVLNDNDLNQLKMDYNTMENLLTEYNTQINSDNKDKWNGVRDIIITSLFKILSKTVNNDLIYKTITTYIDSGSKIPRFIPIFNQSNLSVSEEFKNINNLLRNVLFMYMLVIRDHKFLNYKRYLESHPLVSPPLESGEYYKGQTSKKISDLIMLEFTLDDDFLKNVSNQYYNQLTTHLYTKNNERYISIKKILMFLISCINKGISDNLSQNTELINICYITTVDCLNKITAINNLITGFHTTQIENDKDGVSTYLKIRIDNPKENNLNLSISLDNNYKSVYLKYNTNPNINKQLEIQNKIQLIKKDIISINLKQEKYKNKYNEYESDVKTKIKLEADLLKLQTELKTLGIWDVKNYVFGPFTQIFNHLSTNNQIANKLTNISNDLRNGKNVCIVGYGASGAGKTSTLIALQTVEKGKRVKKEDGILIDLCKGFLVSDEDLLLTVSIKEILFTNTSKNICEMTENNICRDKVFVKSPDSRDWVSDNQSMSEYILTTLENRKIKPTPNNPVSSRSHVIIFVKFTRGSETNGHDSHPLETSGHETSGHETSGHETNVNGNKFNSNLIICDFAGVENRFNCEDITDFLKLENDKRINTDYVKFFNEHCSPDNKYIDYNKKLIKNISNDFINFKSTPQNLKETVKGGEVKVINDLIKQLNLFWESNREELLNIFYSDPNLIETNILKYLNTENKFGSKNFVFNFVVDGKQITISNPQTKKQINKKILELSTQYLLTQLFTYFKQNVLKGNVANIFTVLNDKIVYESCNERVKEGEFINKSLEDFRNAISKYVNPSGKLPEFNNECLPLQCNPMYEECFGNDQKENKTSGSGVVKSQLLDVITDKLGNTNKIIKFCIFNVVNLSGNKNHMIHPYIDISDVVYEYNRLKNYEYQHRYFPHFNPSETESTFQSIFSLFSIINGYNGDNINPDVLNRISTIGLKNSTSSQGSRPLGGILNLDKFITGIKTSNNRDTILTNLNSIIDTITKYNSITSIGTMEYLDMMAKYGVNKTICNFNINVNDTNKNLNIIVDEYKLKINKYLENKYKFGLSDKFI